MGGILPMRGVASVAIPVLEGGEEDSQDRILEENVLATSSRRRVGIDLGGTIVSARVEWDGPAIGVVVVVVEVELVCPASSSAIA